MELCLDSRPNACPRNLNLGTAGMTKKEKMRNLDIAIILASLFVHILIVDASALSGGQAEKESTGGSVTVEYELDAYYSNIGLYITLTDEPIPDAGEKEEGAVYRDLFYSSFIPKFLILEAAVFPMPDIGVFAKKNMKNFYDNFQLSPELNLVKNVTAGFEEPYALSLFAGNVVKFTKPGEKWNGGNFGYMGYLVSLGNYHIKDNELVRDKWMEAEWKVKGDREFSTHELHWSFRVGAKMHSNADIADALYVSVRRSHLDFENPKSFLKNSGLEYTYDMDIKTFEPLKHYFTIDKKWPLKNKKIAFSLAVGFIWEGAEKYTGKLGSDDNEDDFRIIIRPNIIF